MTYDEIKVMEWWIQQGGDFTKKVSESETDAAIKSVLLRLYGLDTEPKPWYESVQISPLDTAQFDVLTSNGFKIKSLGEENNLLDINYAQTDLNQERLKALDGAKDHITWLSLAHSNVQDDWLTAIGDLSNLTRLQLEKTAIGDKGVTALADLAHLEVLNLYGTEVTDSCLQDLIKIKSLKRVYLWQTAVTTDGVASVQDENPELEFVLGNQ